MNELFKDKLSILANDRYLIEAIKSVFLEVIEANKPNFIDVDNDEMLGQKYRAYEKAKEFINQGFLNISYYKEERKEIIKFNKGK